MITKETIQLSKKLYDAIIAFQESEREFEKSFDRDLFNERQQNWTSKKHDDALKVLMEFHKEMPGTINDFLTCDGGSIVINDDGTLNTGEI